MGGRSEVSPKNLQSAFPCPFMTLGAPTRKCEGLSCTETVPRVWLGEALCGMWVPVQGVHEAQSMGLSAEGKEKLCLDRQVPPCCASTAQHTEPLGLFTAPLTI